MEFDVEEFVKRFGTEKTERLLKQMQKHHAAYQALMLPSSKELLGATVKEWEFLFVKVVNNECTDEERIKFAVLDRFLLDSAKKLTAYQENLNETMRQFDKAKVKR